PTDTTPAESKPPGQPATPAQAVIEPAATTRSGVDRASIPQSGANPPPDDPRAVPSLQHPIRPPHHQALSPAAPRESLDPATRASVELTAAAPARAITAAALARAAADRPAPVTEVPPGAAVASGSVTDESSSPGRDRRDARLHT